MKKNLFTIILIYPFLFLAQNKHCASDKVMNNYFKTHPEIKAAFEAREAALAAEDDKTYKQGYKNFAGKFTQNQSTITYTVPVVFHVLHTGGPENISDQQVMDAVSILNRDYRKLNPDTTVTIMQFKGIAADVNMEFALATIDPNGNCTNGIIRHYDVNSNWTSGQFTGYIYTWNTAKYLNIYVVRQIDGGTVGGYTYLPGTFGISNPADVVVIDNTAVGTIGTGWPVMSRALTHEIGHWFNLKHTWGSTNNPGVACGDDGVSDTPITKGSNSNCDTTLSQCNFPVIENAQNYMDYSFCSTMFTTGQVTRMRNTILNNTGNVGRPAVVSAANLMATGAGLPIPQLCPNFKTDKRFLCVGDSVHFSDTSSVNVPVLAWAWSFPGGTPSSSTDSMPVVAYNAGGIYAVSYTATNSLINSAITKNSYIVVYSGATSPIMPFAEGFETAAIPGSEWNVYHNAVSDTTWKITSASFSSGNRSAYINNLYSLPGAVSVLQSGSFDLTNLNLPALSFKLAYQQADVNYSDKLEVFSSIDCGYSWNSIWLKAGTALASVSTVNGGNPFVPMPSEFSNETVDLSGVSYTPETLFKWEFSTDPDYQGNNIYLDDINLYDANAAGITQKEEVVSFAIYPNPSDGKVNIEFNLTEACNIGVEVTDILGRCIEMINLKEYTVNENKLVIGDKKKYEPGVYFVNIDVNGKKISRKIVISR